MADIGDMFQITLQGSNQGETFINAFYYRLMDTPSANHMAGLTTEFDTVIVGHLSDSTPSYVTYDLITVRNLWTGDELVSIPTDRTGSRAVTSQALPSFIAAHCKLVRSNNRVRHGHKYFTGLTEQDAQGQVWAAETMTWLGYIADKYKAELKPGLADTFAPVIIGRVFAPKKNGPGNAYRLPESAEEMGDDWAYITGAAFTPDVTTMRSRKAGHGI